MSALVAAQVLEIAGLEVGVAVEDEHRQRSVELRPDVSCPIQVVFLGAGILREDNDLVPESAPRACKRARVHVRARPTQEVAVPDENLHVCTILTDRSSTAPSGATGGPS